MNQVKIGDLSKIEPKPQKKLIQKINNNSASFLNRFFKIQDKIKHEEKKIETIKSSSLNESWSNLIESPNTTSSLKSDSLLLNINTNFVSTKESDFTEKPKNNFIQTYVFYDENIPCEKSSRLDDENPSKVSKSSSNDDSDVSSLFLILIRS